MAYVQFSTDKIVVALTTLKFVKDQLDTRKSTTNDMMLNLSSRSSSSLSSSSSSSSSSLSRPLVLPSMLSSSSTTMPMVSFSSFDLIDKMKNDYNNISGYDEGVAEEEDDLPPLQEAVLIQRDSILNLTENLTKLFNYSDWNKFDELLYKYTDPKVVTTLESWHGMEFIGIDMISKYFKSIVLANPDLIQTFVHSQALNNLIEAKLSYISTDIYSLRENLYNSNYQNDIIIANTTCARTIRLLPQMNLKNKSSNEVKEILDLLESKDDLRLTGISYLQLYFDMETRKLIKLHVNNQILTIKTYKKT